MSRPGPTLWFRALAVALLGVIGLSAAAWPAQATGCHAAERPVLGLSMAGEGELSASASPERFEQRPAARFTRTPCRGETPSLSGRDMPSAAVAPVVSEVQAPTRRAGRLIPVPDRLPATDLPSGLDRPPRPFVVSPWR